MEAGPSSHLVLDVKTAQTEAFKTLVEALKEIFKDVNIKFTAKSEHNEGSMSIFAVNTHASIIVKLKLPAANFDRFHCEPDRDKGRDHLELGVNMTNLHKLIKTATKNDHLTLYQEASRTNELCIQLDNVNKNCKTIYRLMLLELGSTKQMKINKEEFDFVITMPSADFHNVIKNMGVIAEEVDIKFVSSNADGENRCNLIFSGKGDFASQETVFRNYTSSGEGSSMIVTRTADAKTHTIIQGLYELKSLGLFSKCVTLSTNIELYIKNDYPLVIKYMVANLGHVYMLLSQISKDKMMDEEDYEDAATDEEYE